MGTGVSRISQFRQPPYFTNKRSGYTLIELIVVMSLLGLFLGFAIPRVQDAVVFDQTRKIAGHLISTINRLKQDAVIRQTTHTLLIDLDQNRYWHTNSAMSEELLEKATDTARELPEGIYFDHVTFSSETEQRVGVAAVLFFPQGYSLPTTIHVTDKDHRGISFIIEPFLPKVKMIRQSDRL